MDDINKVIEAISISAIVASFLLNTSRVLQAIELCKECFILLSNKALGKHLKFTRSALIGILSDLMFKGYRILNDHTSGIECFRKLLVFLRGCGERAKEDEVTFKLANFYQLQSKYKEAKEFYKLSLSIAIEIGHMRGEALSCGGLGTVYQSLGEYGKAEENQKKALMITKEIGDREGEAACYGNLGTVYHSLGEYGKAEEYQKKALVITKEIGDKQGEAARYANLGAVYHSLRKYGKAEKYQKKALVITKEIGDRQGEAVCYSNLGTVFESLGEYGKVEECQKKALVITKEIGNRQGEATCFANLGTVFASLGEYGKAEEYQKKALVIRKEIGERAGEAACYANLGLVYQHLGEYGKAEECQTKALGITKEIGDRQGEAICYANIGSVYQSLSEYAKAKEYHEKALAVSKEIGDTATQLMSHFLLACDALFEGNIAQHEVFSNLFSCIRKCEEMRSFLRDNDQFKISFFHEHFFSYHLLSALLCDSGNPNEALCVVELGRARALADLMSAQYFGKQHISVNPKSWAGIERIIENESNVCCLYISYYCQYMFIWVLKGNKPTLFRKTDINDCFVSKASGRKVDEAFGNETFRTFHLLPHEHCEDRSFLSNASHSTHDSSREDSMTAVRLIEDEEDESQQPVPTLAECYQMIIAPVADLLDEPELLIVPDSSLFNVPFAALKDECEKYLSETFRIRIAPSLTTLKLIQDSPAYYHSQTGALIVGDPQVGDVIYRGDNQRFSSLPCARKEAEMIGRLLGAQPLLGKQATKQAVLKSIHSVSLIHFAAHGNAERGEIALAPPQPINVIPQEEDYLLTMADISQVRLLAKLVVLSCCHSARGQIRSEGVVGIARAFLGSGARSVLVALWALEDSATEQLMSRFYEHLVCGESASESLHEAMKWMRSNGYSDVKDWAPFMLIGDNVSFDFGK